MVREGVDERALAGLDLADHRDPAGLIIQDAAGLGDDRQRLRVEMRLQPRGDRYQSGANLFERRADAGTHGAGGGLERSSQRRGSTRCAVCRRPRQSSWPFHQTHTLTPGTQATCDHGDL